MKPCQFDHRRSTHRPGRAVRACSRLVAGLAVALLLPGPKGHAADVPAPMEPDYTFPERLLLPWPCGGPTLHLLEDWRGHMGAGFGLDFGRAAPAGAVEVLAPAAGAVVERGWSDEGYGWHVEIDPGHGWHVLVGHLAGEPEGIGDQVAAGQVLGTMGASGVAEEPHIHVELVPADGRAPDPDRIVRVFGRDRDEFAFRGAPRPVPHPCPNRAGRAVESSMPNPVG